MVFRPSSASLPLPPSLLPTPRTLSCLTPPGTQLTWETFTTFSTPQNMMCCLGPLSFRELISCRWPCTPVSSLTQSFLMLLLPCFCRWIKTDLESINRGKTPFVIVGGHRPMHVASLDGVLPTSNLLVGEETLSAFENLFFLHEVMNDF